MSNTNKMDAFITAYCWMFGSTKKKAREVYKAADESYIDAVVYGFRKNAQEGFYRD